MNKPLAMIEQAAQITAVIHLRIARDQIQQEMPLAISEVLAELSRQGVKIVGPLFAHHLATSADDFDFNVGFPVGTTITVSGRVKPALLPAVTLVQTVYQGSYDGLFQAWRSFGQQVDIELGEQLKQAGLVPDTTFWESYVLGPESDPDPMQWRTELNLPLCRAGTAPSPR